MLRSLVDQHGRRIRLGSLLGKGGEAEVFDVDGDRATAAKLYHQPRDARQSAKLSHMVGRSSPELLRIAAWPTATLHERQGGPLLGFLMPKMEGFEELHSLYNVKSRRTSFPKADWHFLVHAAMNCAAAFDSMHRANIVIADVNARNVCVSARDATVRLVDCDSFQLVSQGDRFLCEVGVPEFTPPELQGKPFTGVVRTANHDCFGLAVLVFHLLFMGRHPFAGRFHGHGEMTQERAIGELRFAFGRMAAAKQMSAPPSSMPLAMLPSGVSDLFEASFSDGGVRARPSAAAWLQSLRQLSSQLRGCTADAAHKYPSLLSACPWCVATDKSGMVYFAGEQIPLVFVCARSDLSSSLSELELLLRQMAPLHPLPAPLGTPTPLPPAVREGQRRLLAVDIGYFSVLLSVGALANHFAVVAPSSSGVVLCVLAAVWLLGMRLWYGALSPLKDEKRTRARSLESAYREAYECGEHLRHFNEEQKKLFDESSAAAARIANVYTNLQPSFTAEQAALARNARESQRQAFLDGYQIADASISGFGRDRKAKLLYLGIESAWDVRKGPLPHVTGIGTKLREALEAWAAEIEGQFRFDATKGAPEAERRALVARYRRQQTAMRAELGKLCATASTTVSSMSAIAGGLLQRSAVADARLSQARADASVTTTSFPRLLLGTIAIVMLMAVIIAAGRQDRGESYAEPPPAAVSPPAPVAEPAATSELEIMSVGAGESYQVRWGGAGLQKQRVELTVDASLLITDSNAPARPVVARALVALKDLSGGVVEVQFLIESVKLLGTQEQSREELAIVSQLSNALLAIKATSAGRILESKVLRRSRSKDPSTYAIEALISVLCNLFVELPQDRVALGLGWRIRSSSTTALVRSATASEIILDLEKSNGEKLRLRWTPGKALPSLEGELKALPLRILPL
jgi:DNA-binding helix-hairpin-helix protein with protein kinase domain